MCDSMRNNRNGDGAVPSDNCKTNDDLFRVIVSFVKSQLGLNPDEIFIDEHGSCINVTLKNVFADAERNAAKDKSTAILIAKTFTESFLSVRGILLAACTETLKMPVESATFLLDPQSNYASILLTVERLK